MSDIFAIEAASGHVQLPQSDLCSSPVRSWPSELLLIEPDPSVLSSRTLLLTQSSYRVTVAMSPQEVVWLRGSKIHLAVVSASLSPDNLRAIAEIIRRQGGSARILVVGKVARVLEDQLYDEAIDSSSSSENLLVVLRKLSAFTWGKGGDAHSAESRFFATAPTADLLADRESEPESDPTKTPHFERERLVIPHDMPAGERRREEGPEGQAHGSLNDQFAGDPDTGYLSRRS